MNREHDQPLQKFTSEAKLLIFCNKSDLPMSKHPEIMANELGINVLTDREVFQLSFKK